MISDRGVIYLIKRLEMGLRRPFIDLASAHQITYGQYTALTVLLRRPGLTSSELARLSFVSAQNMAELIKPLIAAGLVRRETHPDHGHRFKLLITQAGIDQIEPMTRDVRRLEDQLLNGLDEAQIESLRVLLRELSHRLT